MRHFLTGLVCVAVTVLFSGWVLAGPIAINNPGFETGVLDNAGAKGPYGFTIPDWTGGTGPTPPVAGVYRPIATISIPPEGENVAFTNGPTIAQVLADVLSPYNTYALTVQVGERTDRPSTGYLVELLAGGVVLASDSGVTAGPGSWLTSTVNYTSGASSGGALEIRLSTLGGYAPGTQVLFDEASLTQAVPEPATFSLIGFGLIGLVAVSRRPRKR